MPLEMTYTEKLIVTHCWCGIALAIPENLYDWLNRSTSNTCHCPVGHRFHFTYSMEKKLEEERRAHRATRDLLTAEERSHSATKGVLTKTRKRVANGVCPCCHRSFANLERHMTAKHPDYPEKA